MTFDLLLLCVVLVAAVAGALVGASRQVAQVCALAVAFYAGRPLGAALGPRMAGLLHVSRLTGTMAAIVFVFLVLFLASRYAFTQVFRSLLAGTNAQHPGVDRWLGFGLGGLKAAAIGYVLLSALAFADARIRVGGKSIGFAPHGSRAFAFAKEHNLFEMAELASVRSLAQVINAAHTPEARARLRADPAFRALMADPAFRRIALKPELQPAFFARDYPALLHDDAVLQLVDDAKIRAELDAAAAAASR